MSSIGLLTKSLEAVEVFPQHSRRNTQLFIKRELFHANAALGSCGETRNHLLTAYQNNYISEEQYKILDEKFLEVIKMLYGYIKMLKSNLDNESVTIDT